MSDLENGGANCTNQFVIKSPAAQVKGKLQTCFVGFAVIAERFPRPEEASVCPCSSLLAEIDSTVQRFQWSFSAPGSLTFRGTGRDRQRVRLATPAECPDRCERIGCALSSTAADVYLVGGIAGRMDAANMLLRQAVP